MKNEDVKQVKGAKAYLLTLNEIEKYEKIHKYLLGLKMLNYYIATKEIAPTTGHEHIHIYCQFNNSIRLSLKKLLGAHIDPCRGSPQQNLEYIYKTKEPEKRGIIFDEWGELRTKGGNTINDVIEMSREERKNLPIQYFKIIKQIDLEEDIDIPIKDIYKNDIQVFYIWGPSEMDKTKDALQMFLDNGYKKINMVKYEDGFWHGIGNCKAALYDDFRDSHMRASEFINFIDYNKHPMNVKGGTKLNEYIFIIITSVQNPNMIYESLANKCIEPKKQWLRRMNIIHKSKFEDCKRPPIKFTD